MAPVIRQNGNKDEYIINKKHPQLKLIIAGIMFVWGILAGVFGLGGSWFLTKKSLENVETMLPEIQAQLQNKDVMEKQITTNEKDIDKLCEDVAENKSSIDKIETTQKIIWEKVK